MLLKKAALRRFILPAVLRELLLTGCVLKSVVLAHCADICCCSWSQDSTAEEVACPKRALLIRLATQRECCVTSTSMRCFVFSGLRLRHTRKNSCPSSHKPPMLVKMKGRHDDSVRRRFQKKEKKEKEKKNKSFQKKCDFRAVQRSAS